MSVVSSANLDDFHVVKANVGVDTALLEVGELKANVIYCNEIYDNSGNLELNGDVGINVDATLSGVTTIAGAPATNQVVYIGGNDGTDWGVNTSGTKTIHMGCGGGVGTINICTGADATGANVVNICGAGATGTGAINIGTGATGVKTIAIGGTAANVITIANTQTGGSLAIGTAMTTGTISIGGTGLQTGTVDIAPGTGAQTVNVGTGGTGVKTINIGTGAVANVITIGSVTDNCFVNISAQTTLRTRLNTNSGGLAVSAAQSGSTIRITTNDNVTFGVMTPGCYYDFIVAVVSTATITTTNGQMVGSIAVVDQSGTAECQSFTSSTNTIITLTNTQALPGSHFRLIWAAASGAASVNVCGLFYSSAIGTTMFSG